MIGVWSRPSPQLLPPRNDESPYSSLTHPNANYLPHYFHGLYRRVSPSVIRPETPIISTDSARNKRPCPVGESSVQAAGGVICVTFLHQTDKICYFPRTRPSPVVQTTDGKGGAGHRYPKCAMRHAAAEGQGRCGYLRGPRDAGSVPLLSGGSPDGAAPDGPAPGRKTGAKLKIWNKSFPAAV